MTGESKQGKGGRWRPMLYEGNLYVGSLGSPHGFATKEEADAFGMNLMGERMYWEASDGLKVADGREWR